MNNIQKFGFREVFDESECERLETVHSYMDGLLTEEQREDFERHLAVCSVCARRITDIEESRTAVENIVFDSEKADRIFRENRSKLEKLVNKKYGISSSAIPVFRSFKFPSYINVMMIVLIAVLIYPSYRSFILQQEVAQLRTELAAEKERVMPPPFAPNRNEIEVLKQQNEKLLEPAISPSVVFPVRAERSTEAKTITARFSETQNRFSVVFALPEEDLDGYVFEISQNGQTIWQSSTPAQTGLISVNLNSSYLKPGAYLLHVYSAKAGTRTQLTQYKLLVEK